MRRNEYKTIKLGVKVEMEHEQFLKKWKHRLVYCWANGLDDQDAANKLGIDYEEMERHMNMDAHLRQIRDKHLDELTRIAKGHIADKIKAGDRQTCEWYLEKRCPEFGAKVSNTSIEDDEPDDEIDDFLDGFQAKPDMFDGN